MHVSEPPTRVIVITGPVGAGKTTTAGLLADQLVAAGVPSAFIDLDALRWFGPRPADDRFGAALGLANLAAVAANYRAAGMRCLVLADVVEAPAQRATYEQAIPDAAITIVRLSVAPAVLAARLIARHDDPDERAWYLARAPELEALMRQRGVGDIVIEVGDASPASVAARIAVACGLD